MIIQCQPIGVVSLPATGIIPHSIDEREGMLVIGEKYCAGLQDIQAGQRILVLFYFHRSPAFTPNDLTQALPHTPERRGVFSLRSPLRPNPIGVTVVDILRVDGCRLYVKGLDVFDGTPILDIKPYVESSSA